MQTYGNLAERRFDKAENEPAKILQFLKKKCTIFSKLIKIVNFLAEVTQQREEGPLSDVPINQSNVARSSSSKITQESTRAQMITTTQKCLYNRAKLSKLNGMSKFVRFIHQDALIFHDR